MVSRSPQIFQHKIQFCLQSCSKTSSSSRSISSYSSPKKRASSAAGCSTPAQAAEDGWHVEQGCKANVDAKAAAYHYAVVKVEDA